MKRSWQFYPRNESLGRQLERELGLSPVVASLLVNRGCGSMAEARSFLTPQLKDLIDPFAMQDMPKAAERLARAVKGGERIVIYGDYDVDGVSGTALLLQFFRLLRANVATYIPNRNEGYSISDVGARNALALAPKVVITVDNGTSAVRGVNFLQQNGVDVIVTDHHLPADEMAPAFAIVNPRRRDCSYPFKWLSGAGVAFKLAWGVSKVLCNGPRVTRDLRDFLLEAMSYATLGTIADMVPLVGENRILARHGLQALGQSTRPGLRALIELAGLRGPLRAASVSFKIAPRLNAAGRLGHADAALRLLTCDSESEARELAQKLETENGRRQQIERALFEEAMAAAEPHLADAVLVLASDRWHLGVIGIVAARLVEAHHRPVFLIALAGERGRGSGRSVAGVDLHALIERSAHTLVGGGGHAMAAGLEIETHRVDEFRKVVNEAAATLGARAAEPRIAIDSELPLPAITHRLLHELDRLSPFGEGNGDPVFASTRVTLAGPPRPVGPQGNHSLLRLSQGGATFSAFLSGPASRLSHLKVSADYNVAYTPRINQYRGLTSIELSIRDFEETP